MSCDGAWRELRHVIRLLAHARGLEGRELADVLRRLGERFDDATDAGDSERDLAGLLETAPGVAAEIGSHE
jgi:hypothetical protein